MPWSVESFAFLLEKYIVIIDLVFEWFSFFPTYVMSKWEDLVRQLTLIKEEFNRSYKCLNRTPLPSPHTQAKHLNNLVLQHNTIAATLRTFYSLLTPTHQQEADTFFKSVKSKLKYILKKLEINDTVPENNTSIFQLNFIEEESDDSEDTASGSSTTEETSQTPAKAAIISPKPDQNSENQSNSVNMTPAEFLNLIAKLMPEYDGSADKLPNIVSALDLIESLKGDHENLAVAYIKTKITGRSQNLVAPLTTITTIKDTLKSTVKGETAKSVTSKMLALKQNSKEPTVFAKELEELSLKLENAYILEGLPASFASKFATEATVKALQTNARSAESRLLLKAGQFNTVNEAVTKFVELSSETAEIHSINYPANSKHTNKH